MRTAIFSIGLTLSAIVASAQRPSFTLTLTPENAGADTRFSWSYTGTPAYAAVSVGETLTMDSVEFYSQSLPWQPTTGSSGPAFTSNLSAITGLTTGLYLTNTTTGQDSTFSQIRFIGGAGLILLDMQIRLDGALGEQIVLSGPTSGSFLSGLAFSNFNIGSWTTQGDHFNFDANLIISTGAPVPEPSTYGLMLGGLALVGTVIRRRRK